MHDLSRYYSVRDRMLPGDLLLFDGSADSDVCDLVEHVLSNGIEVFTRSNWSHSALVNDPDTLIESTITDRANGVQINSIAVTLQNYDGCNISWLPLLATVRQALDMEAAMDWARSRVGRDRYSVATIGRYILRTIGLGGLFPRRSIPGEEVCSEFVAMTFQRAGLEALLDHRILPNLCSPETLFHWPIFAAPVQLIRT